MPSRGSRSASCLADTARRRPSGYGVAAFAHFATMEFSRPAEPWVAKRLMPRRYSPPSPFGLWRGSLHSRRYDGVFPACRAVAREATHASPIQPAVALRAMAWQPSLTSLRWSFPGLLSRVSRSASCLAEPSPFGLWRGSLHSLRYDGVFPACRAVAREASEGWWGRQDSNLRSHEAADLQLPWVMEISFSKHKDWEVIRS
ncbi:hypothetical protein ACVMIH_002322 [Bradyrhizobium sp. USDA 4503]